MTARLAAWAEAPLSMDQAAVALGVSRRTLTESLKRLPYYELRGKKKVFYPEHIAALRNSLRIVDPLSGAIADGKRRGVPGDVMTAVLDRDRRTCVYCHVPGQGIEFDHVIPLALGGNSTVGNIVVSCRSCNRQKGRKTLTEYIAWRAERGLPVFAVLVQ